MLQTQNHHHIQAPIEAPDMSAWQARKEARPEAVKVIADFVFAERMASIAWIGDAQGDFSQAEYDAMTAAIHAAGAKQAAS